jgi:uncharacterized delta-60 repeat protein
MNVCGLLFVTTAYAAPGDVDPTFAHSGEIELTEFTGSAAMASVMQPDGKLVFAGRCGAHACLVRLAADGLLDNTFATNGYAVSQFGHNSAFYAVRLQPDGKIVTAGECRMSANANRSICVARFTSGGEPDSNGFGLGGSVIEPMPNGGDERAHDIAVMSDGALVVSVKCSIASCLMKYASNGVKDSSFGTAGLVQLIAGVFRSVYRPFLMKQLNGKIVVGFSECFSPSGFFPCVMRVDANGVADAQFGVGGVAGFGAGGFGAKYALLADDSIVAAFESPNGTDFYIAKLTPNGANDSTFGSNGRTILPGGQLNVGVSNIVQLHDGRLLVAGTCSTGQSANFCFARLLPEGAGDTTFSLGGHRAYHQQAKQRTLYAAQSLANEKFVGAGYCISTEVGASAKFCVSRYKGGPYPGSACALNADANDAIAASSDAMLVTRYLLGFQGETLTNGAIGQNATRTADEIVAYLDSLKNDPARKLDLDGDGLSLAMTDGLLMLRAMLGLSGDALTVGALGQTSASFPTLRTPQQILQWIEATHGVACLP